MFSERCAVERVVCSTLLLVDLSLPKPAPVPTHPHAAGSLCTGPRALRPSCRARSLTTSWRTAWPDATSYTTCLRTGWPAPHPTSHAPCSPPWMRRGRCLRAWSRAVASRDERRTHHCVALAHACHVRATCVQPLPSTPSMIVHALAACAVPTCTYRHRGAGGPPAASSDALKLSSADWRVAHSHARW